MKEEVIAILQDLHPEVDFNNASLSLVRDGILDSFDIVQIIADLDNVFEIKISGTELIPENFDSIQAIISLVERTRGQKNEGND